MASVPPIDPGRSPLATATIRRRRRRPGAIGPSVLVVEDEPGVRHLLRRALESHGYRVIEAADTASGIAQCAEVDPDLVILDLGLPDRDGREQIAECRRRSRCRIVVVSGRTG